MLTKDAIWLSNKLHSIRVPDPERLRLYKAANIAEWA